MEEFSSLPLEGKKERIRAGNEKLKTAWTQIKNMVHDQPKWEEELERWHQAHEKLSGYCSQLKAEGFNDCLYITYYEGLSEEDEKAIMNDLAEGKVTEVVGKKGVKTRSCLLDHCWVCPSSHRYWEQELMELSSAAKH